MKRESSSYLNNPKLKKAGVKQEYTPEMIKEILKCSDDPLYFIKKYVKIVSLDEGLIDMNPYPFQEKMIKAFHENRFCVALVARQSGKTVAYMAYALWYILFNENKHTVILANKSKTAKSILARLKLAYENLPIWLQQGITEWNKTSIELENSSRVVADSTSGNAARGESINLLILDEFAFVPNNIAEDFFRSVYPTISKGTTTKIIIVSTPNGVNLFYKIWEEAKKKQNLYVPFTMHWSDVPGRDAKWREDTIKNIGLESFQQEYELSFFGSVTDTLISGNKLRILPIEKPLYSSNDLDVYQMPEKDKLYVMALDTARGGGADYSAITIFDITKLPYRLVAKFRSNKIKALEFPMTILDLAKKYNDAYILVESNDIGAQVADIIKYEYEYENIFSSVLDKNLSMYTITLGGGRNTKLGIMTSKKVKNIGCSSLKTLMETDNLIIQDFDIISELTNFISTKNSFGARPGETDDLVMTLVLFSWLTQQKFFKQLTDSNILELLKKRKEEEEFSDIPFILRGPGIDIAQESIVDSGDMILVETSFDEWLK